MSSHRNSWVGRVCSALLIAAMVLTVAPAATLSAQEESQDETPVLIFPVNRAQFLPGVNFDFHVEVHSAELPEDFAITVNGEPAADFFGAEGTEESWQFSEEADNEEELAEVEPESIVDVQAMRWRDVTLNEPGTYTATVTADGAEHTVEWTVREPSEDAGAQNVILFIADGGSIGLYSAARLLSRGIDQGTFGENLIFEDFEELGFLHTSGIDSIITDSANSSSAYNTGHKTAVNANGVYPDTSYDKFDDPRTEKFAYLIDRLADMSIGIVTTSNWSDATPNGVAGYGRDRSNEALNVYLTQPLDSGLLPEVILGGGARNMLPMSAEGSRRDDERDLFAEYEEAGYTLVTTGSELTELVPAAADVAMTTTMEVTDTEDMTPTVEMGEETDVDATAMEESIVTETEEITVTVELTASETVTEGVETTAELPERLLGIFHPHHMDVWLDKHVFTENVEEFPDQPDLDTMTLAALEVLGQDEDGFYLMVEAASVDKPLHPMDFERALADMIEFERAVAATVEWAEENAPDTLIVVTSDHAHSYDVYGTVDIEVFNAAEDDSGRREAIGIYADAGFPTYEDADGDYFPDDWAPNIVIAQGKVDNPVFTEDFQVSEVYRTPSVREPVEDEDLPYESITVDNPEDDPNGLPLGGNLPEGSTSSVHTMQSVPVYAQGPGSDCFGRSMENIEVFFCMAEAIGLNPAAE